MEEGSITDFSLSLIPKGNVASFESLKGKESTKSTNSNTLKMSWVSPSSSTAASSFPSSSSGWVGGGNGKNNSGKQRPSNKKNGARTTTTTASGDATISTASAYRALVVDSGPIIRHTGLSSLYGKADSYYTVPAVLNEIRDAKARTHLETLPFQLIPKEPSKESIHTIIEFSKLTGDFQSLSAVDIQVLALVYELEKEGCCTQGEFANMGHIRKTPKRTVGVGKIQALNNKPKEEGESKEGGEEKKNGNEENETKINGLSFFESEIEVVDDDDDEEEDDDRDDSGDEEDAGPSDGVTEKKEENEATIAKTTTTSSAPKTWAMLVNPTAASRELPKVPDTSAGSTTIKPMDVSDDRVLGISFGNMNLLGTASKDEADVGQFSDAEEGEEDNDNEQGKSMEQNELERELQSDFPSLQAALTVPYEGSDTEDDGCDNDKDVVPLGMSKEEQERRKQQSLQPVSKSGKLYNSFRRYGDLMKPKPPQPKQDDDKKIEEQDEEKSETPADDVPQQEESTSKKPTNESRIMGGVTMSGQEMEVEDDGEGWITCGRDIQTMKSAGALDPSRTPADALSAAKKEPVGPPNSIRTACTTTDFAMQNVILQMNLELLSVDGIKIRRLKSWVTRCGACFKIYADGDSSNTIGNANKGGKRLFCSHCGSDFMQRIAASVDSKTGRLRLHMSKKYKNNLRGTKFSLPKAGTGNRFQGDLLLREDQLMMGAWNQKVKILAGGKSRATAQSIFGKDLASNVGCNPKLVNSATDIQVGFGRRNPNAAKGRERRGKKKKSTDRACGLHRY